MPRQLLKVSSHACMPTPTQRKTMAQNSPSEETLSGEAGPSAVSERMKSTPNIPLPTPVQSEQKMPTA
eukprot:scaffold23608_cov24-Tisochrysis_lutea.AAC.4